MFQVCSGAVVYLYGAGGFLWTWGVKTRFGTSGELLKIPAHPVARHTQGFDGSSIISYTGLTSEIGNLLQRVIRSGSNFPLQKYVHQAVNKPEIWETCCDVQSQKGPGVHGAKSTFMTGRSTGYTPPGGRRPLVPKGFVESEGHAQNRKTSPRGRKFDTQ